MATKFNASSHYSQASWAGGPLGPLPASVCFHCLCGGLEEDLAPAEMMLPGCCTKALPSFVANQDAKAHASAEKWLEMKGNEEKRDRIQLRRILRRIISSKGKFDGIKFGWCQ